MLSNQQRGIEVQTWSNAIQREVRFVEDSLKLVVPARPPSIQDPLFLPRLLEMGKGTYDCKENLDLKEGKVAACEVEAIGLMKEMDVAYFVSGLNRWHASKLRFETWYHGKVKRQ